jgi:hypothetical protein
MFSLSARHTKRKGSDMITDRDLRNQIQEIIDAGEGDSIDVDGVYEEIHRTHGLVNLDDVDSDEFWTVVAAHDAS